MFSYSSLAVFFKYVFFISYKVSQPRASRLGRRAVTFQPIRQKRIALRLTCDRRRQPFVGVGRYRSCPDRPLRFRLEDTCTTSGNPRPEGQLWPQRRCGGYAEVREAPFQADTSGGGSASLLPLGREREESPLAVAGHGRHCGVDLSPDDAETSLPGCQRATLVHPPGARRSSRQQHGGA